MRWHVLPLLQDALKSDACEFVREQAARALQAVASGDPAGSAAHVVEFIGCMLSECTITRQEPNAVSLRLERRCRKALARATLALAFLGWRLECRTGTSSLSGRGGGRIGGFGSANP